MRRRPSLVIKVLRSHLYETEGKRLKWQNTKAVHIMSDYHSMSMTTARRTSKSGEKNDYLHKSSHFLQWTHGRCGQIWSVCGFLQLRPKIQWWKKVFFKFTKTALINAWILCKNVKCKKNPQLPFIISTAEDVIAYGIRCTTVWIAFTELVGHVWHLI